MNLVLIFYLHPLNYIMSENPKVMFVIVAVILIGFVVVMNIPNGKKSDSPSITESSSFSEQRERSSSFKSVFDPCLEKEKEEDLSRQWQQVFHDDFSRAYLDYNYPWHSKSLKIVKNEATGRNELQSAENIRYYFYLSKCDFAGDFRLEVKIRQKEISLEKKLLAFRFVLDVPKPNLSTQPSQITNTTNKKKKNLNTDLYKKYGYIIKFGTRKNTGTAVKAKGAGSVFFREGRLTPGKSQLLVLQRIDDRIRLEVDGVEVFHHTDLEAFRPGRPGPSLFIDSYSGNVVIEEITFSKLAKKQ